MDNTKNTSGEILNEPLKTGLSPRQMRLTTHKKWARRMWYLYLGGVAALVIFFYSLSYDLPSFELLENPRSRIASEIYSSDGELMGKFYIENRSPVPYDSLSPHLVKALIATEDARFYEHSGIDATALGRVFVKTFLLGNTNAGGGSTISQQLAKLLVGRPDTRGRNGLVRLWLIGTTKLKEWLTAVRLERSYTKEEILALYFNEFDFLYGACGIKSASEIYFAKLPNELSIPESAMLVRMLQNPSLHNPRRSMERAKKGRSEVLRRMRDAGHISEGDYEKYNNEPIDISKFKVTDHNEGIATYFREHLRDQLNQYFAQLQREGKLDKKYDIYRDGLKIYTTIDGRMQRLAEKAAWDHLSKHQEKLFKEWSGWNTENKSTNPWLYQPKGVRDDQILLRLQTLERMVSESDRYKYARPEYMPKTTALEVTDPDILRMRQLEKMSAKRDSLTASWLRFGYVTQDQVTKYNNILRSAEWTTIKKEHDAIIDYMKKPVAMKVFAYNKASEKDTVMSPFDSVRYHRMHLQTGMMAMEPHTGYVRAWVGGINHKYFKYDHVNRKAKRQVGSSIKPFLYALTVDMRGYSSCSQVTDMQTTIHAGEARFGLTRDWTPKNAGGGYSGATMTLTQALTKSLNSISAKLMKDLGSPQPFRNLLGDMSFDTISIAQSPTICLGAADISVFEMTGGYSIFANSGTHTPPIFIDRIEDKNGNIIYMGETFQEKKQILSEQGAYVMNQMLQAVQRAAGGFAGIKSPHGGKTGTTNFQADGWYMGITPSLVIGTWVGCDDRFIRFKGLANGAGAKMARPIYQNFLRYLEAENDLSFYNYTLKFQQPDIIERELECGKFKGMNFGDEDGPTPADDITNDQYIYDYE
jgi:penicillin-binding protein 1A